MVLSRDKIKMLFISNSQANSQQKPNNHFKNVKISNTTIDEVHSTKLLGVNVDKRLSWCMQVAQVKKAPFIDYSFLRKLENIYHNELEYSFMIIMSRH